MAETYKIAVASSDGVHVDGHFGSTSSFLIIEVGGDGSYRNKEERTITAEQLEEAEEKTSCGEEEGCGNNRGGSCGGGHSDPIIEKKASLISDCRCLLCKMIGPGARKQLERKAISIFQVDCEIDEALKKITEYFYKMDNHITLRKKINT